MSEEQNRSSRKTLTGVVTSKTGDKSIKVTYFYKMPHPIFRKEIKRKTVIHAHDEKNECNVGDNKERVQRRRQG